MKDLVSLPVRSGTLYWWWWRHRGLAGEAEARPRAGARHGEPAAAAGAATTRSTGGSSPPRRRRTEIRWTRCSTARTGQPGTVVPDATPGGAQGGAEPEAGLRAATQRSAVSWLRWRRRTDDAPKTSSPSRRAPPVRAGGLLRLVHAVGEEGLAIPRLERHRRGGDLSPRERAPADRPKGTSDAQRTARRGRRLDDARR
jgi:hypothetical protein